MTSNTVLGRVSRGVRRAGRLSAAALCLLGSVWVVFALRELLHGPRPVAPAADRGGPAELTYLYLTGEPGGWSLGDDPTVVKTHSRTAPVPWDELRVPPPPGRP